MNKSVLCLFILIIGLALGMGAACASENLDAPASVDESPMEVENGEALSSREGNALEESQTTENNNLKESQTTESEEGLNGSSNPLDSKLSAPQNDPALTANEGTFDDLQRLIEANYGGTLVLDSNYRYNSNYDFKSIPITQSITIDGNNSVLNGNAETMIFTITGDNVVLKNIIFTEGYGGAIRWNGKGGTLINCTFDYNLGYDGANGGSVYWNGDDGTMMDCIFTNNIAEGNGGAVYWDADGGSMIDCSFIDNIAEGNGGAVFWNGTEANLINCNFNNNRAKYGGAVYSFRSFDGIVANCNFTDNYASTDGGAFYFSRSFNGIVTNCNFTANNASTSGGAIWIYSGSVENCIFTNNSASNYGGAVIFFLQGGVINCNFTNNTGNMGGAVLASECDLLNCNFAYNNASSLGGAVYLSGYKNSNIIDCNFTKNSAFSGGAIFIRENGNITNCNFVDNNASSQGGAISIFAQVIVTNCNFTGNNASTKGGALYLYERATVEKCSFTNNIALIDGGAIYSYSRSIVTDCNFIGNNASGNGGAVYFIVRGAIANCNFTDSTSSYGGAIYFYYGDADVTDCNFAGNTAKEGGALFFMHDGGDVTGCNFTGNNASDNGGAILFNCSNGVVTGCNFAGNNALISAGAIHFASTGSVSNSNFTDNSAGQGGGALYIYNGVTVSFSNFINNSADAGGAIFLSSGSLSDCNFTGNEASSYGGAIFFYYGDGEVTNCNFIDNSADVHGGAVYFSINGEVSDCNFINNNASENGGAVYFIANGVVTGCNFTGNNASENGGAVFFLNEGNVTGCNFADNSAGQYGGAVHFYGIDSKGRLLNCEFVNNSAGLYGGALNMYSGSVLNCNFTDNSADAGGASFIVYGNVTNCNFIKNSASNGGAVLIYYIGTVLDCNFDDNSADYGGAIFFIDVSRGNVTNCNFTCNIAADGGAILIQSGSVSNCNFIDNKAAQGGAISNYNSAGVSNCNFTGNTASNTGGALNMYSGSVLNCNFADNTASSYGGAIYTSSLGSVSYCNFINNNASSGADLWVTGNAKVTVNDSFFYGTVEEYNSITLYLGELNLVRNYIYGNVVNKNQGILYLDTNDIDGFIINEGNIATLTVATFLDNKTVPAELDDNVRVYATLVDDNGNSIIDERFNITVNGAAVENVKYDKNNRLYAADYTINTPGENLVSTTYRATVVKTGIFDVPKADVTEFSIVVGKSNIVPYGENAEVFVTLVGINGVGLNETLTVIVNNKPYTVTLKNGKGSFNVSGLASGHYSALGMFSGNSQYNSAYATGLFSVLAPETRLTVNVEDIVVGEDLHVKINLTDADGNPIMGMVNLSGDLFETSVVVNGYLEIPVSGVLAGNYTIAVSFAGDDTYESADNATTFEVKQVSDYVFLATAGTGFDFGQTVYVSVTLPDDATGTVNITINGRTYDAVVENGEATIEIPDLAAGDYPEWEVFYSGDNKYVPGVTNTDIYVFPADAELEVYFDKDTITYGEYAVLFIGINADATGTIAVYNIDDDENPVLITNITVQEALEEGVTIDDLNAGLHFFEIRYSGDMNFTEDTRRDFLSVEKAFVNWTVEDVPGEIDVGENIDIVLGLTNPSDASGKLNITVDGKQIGVYTFDEVKDGISLNVFNKSGTYTIVISALDDSNYDYAGPFEFVVTVNSLVPDMELNVTEKPKVGDLIEVTVTLNDDATGVVDFIVDGELFKSGVELSNGTVTIDLGNLAAGNHNVIVYYSGDDVYSEASDKITFEVVKITPDIEIGVDPADILAGGSATVTITLPSDVTNFVFVDINGKPFFGIPENGEFVVDLDDLDAVTYDISVTYVGDDKYNKATAESSFTVGKDTSSISADVPETAKAEEEFTVTVTVTPEGTSGNYSVFIDGVDVTGEYGELIISDGKGSFIVSGLSEGKHTIGVRYNGDANYLASEVANYNIEVSKTNLSGDDIKIDIPIDVEVGEDVVINVTLPEDATGNITVIVDGEEVGPVELENGTAVIPLGELDAGNHTITVTYSGDDKYDPYEETFTIEVAPAGSSVIIDDIVDVVYDANVEISYTVENETVVTVVVKDADGNEITAGVDTSVSGKVIISGLDAGKYTISITNAAQGNYLASSDKATFYVLKSDVTIAPEVSGDLVVDGKVNVTFTLPGDIDGDVSVTIDGAEAVAVLVGDKYVVSFDDLTAGKHTVVVKLDGDTNYKAAAGSVTFDIAKVNPEITISDIEANVGDTVEVTVTIAGGDATGLVLFEGKYYVVENGKATVPLTVENSGMQSISVVYAGDDKYNGDEAFKGFNAGKGDSFIDADVPGTVDGGVNFTVTVTVTPDAATGNYSVFIDGTDVSGDYGSLVLVGGKGSFIVSGLAPGKHVIGVRYNGDVNYDSSDIANYNIEVSKIDESANIEIDLPRNVKVGDVAVVNVTLPEDATGKVSVLVNGKVVNTVDLENGKANIPVEGLAAGTSKITVTYSGDDKYAPITSKDMDLIVDKVVPTITVKADDIKAGQVAVIIVTVPDDATGRVFVDLGVTKVYGDIKDGKAIINVSGLAEGTYGIKALYEGDSKYDEASNVNTFEVIKETYAIKVTMIDGLKLTGVLTDGDGNPVSNAVVSYTLDNGEAVSVITNDKGEFVCDVESDSVLTMSYAKGDEVLCNASITLKNINPNRQSTWIDVPANMQMTASDFKKGEAGQIFAFYLRDANGNGLANKVIKIGIFDKKYTVKTDATGRAELPIRIENANYYTYAPAFLGDKDYEASLGVCSLLIVKKSTTITPAKTSYSFASSAKTKTVTATLKSTNSFIPNGKQATLTIAGKTFKATIGDKGQINFNIGSITLKGTYKVQIKFAGTNTYAASNSQTITIKIA